MEVWQNKSLITLDEESWTNIVDFEGRYMISTLGRVKSLERKTSTVFVKEKILTLKNSGEGYIQAKLSKEGKIIMPLVHRLVALHYLPNPNNFPEVGHKDNIRWHNWVSNLYWCTTSQNAKHAFKTGNRNQMGELNNQAKITQEIADAVRYYYELNEHLSYREIGEYFGLNKDHVKLIINYKIWAY